MKSVAALAAQMDAPTTRYQKYLQDLQDWEQRREEIIGSEQDSGSVRFFERQIKDFDDLPKQLAEATQEREKKTREIYNEIEKLVSTYKSLYSPCRSSWSGTTSKGNSTSSSKP
jgi:predicted  nucleic acid-binding Zn-ribbon protein